MPHVRSFVNLIISFKKKRIHCLRLQRATPFGRDHASAIDVPAASINEGSHSKRPGTVARLTSGLWSRRTNEGVSLGSCLQANGIYILHGGVTGGTNIAKQPGHNSIDDTERSSNFPSGL